MNDLLIHTSSVRVDVLRPAKAPGFDRPAICFALNQFVSHFGEHVYLFDRRTLEESFFVERIPSGGVSCWYQIDVGPVPRETRYRSQDLGYEFRVYEPVDVRRYALGVVTNFNHLRGVLEERIGDRMRREVIDLSREGA